MAGLKQKIKGSTIVEAVVASVLFLLVFFICLESVTRMNSMRSSEEPMEVEMDFNNCVRKFLTGNYDLGEYTETYHWGKISIDIRPYPKYDDIRELDFMATFNNNRRAIRYRLLNHLGYEE